MRIRAMVVALAGTLACGVGVASARLADDRVVQLQPAASRLAPAPLVLPSVPVDCRARLAVLEARTSGCSVRASRGTLASGRDSLCRLRAAEPKPRPCTQPLPQRGRRLAPPVVHSPAVPHVSRSGGVACTAGNWRSLLAPDELWIDTRESHVNPRAQNPSGALGLGQLLPSTYRDLGLVVSWDPCDEIHAQRAYMRDRYKTWAAARAWWANHRWW